MPQQPFIVDTGQTPGRESWLPFVIRGKRADGVDWSEEFAALPSAPASALQHLLNAPKVDPGTGAVGYLAPDVVAFIRAMLGDDSQRSRFDRLLGDSTRHVHIVDLVKLMQWLTEATGGFPTGQPSGSAAGASPAGLSYAAAQSPPGWPTPDPGTAPMGPSSPTWPPTLR
jgi:hypothetical protein